MKSTAEPENKEETLLSVKLKMIYHTSNYHELEENVSMTNMKQRHLKSIKILTQGNNEGIFHVYCF